MGDRQHQIVLFTHIQPVKFCCLRRFSGSDVFLRFFMEMKLIFIHKIVAYFDIAQTSRIFWLM